MTITVVDAGPYRVCRSAEALADCSSLFELVADPRRHGELDGSCTVRNTVTGAARVFAGQRFSVEMKQYGVPDRNHQHSYRVRGWEGGGVAPSGRSSLAVEIPAHIENITSVTETSMTAA